MPTIHCIGLWQSENSRGRRPATPQIPSEPIEQGAKIRAGFGQVVQPSGCRGKHDILTIHTTHLKLTDVEASHAHLDKQ